MAGTLGSEYLEISPNLLTCLPRARPPVNLYRYDEGVDRVVLYRERDRVLSSRVKAEMESICQEGRLFLARGDFAAFSELLSRNLGAALFEDTLGDGEKAVVVGDALAARLGDFLSQPLASTVEPLAHDLALLADWLWADSNRVFSLKRGIRVRRELTDHGVNVCLLGTALYVLSSHEKDIREHLSQAALGFLLHDVGMTNVPDHIRGKESTLLHKERVRVEEHPEVGLKILRRVGGLSERSLRAVAEHHERLDGSGYPRRLKAGEISREGRVCALADAYAAMTNERLYARTLSAEEGARTIVSDKGFDPLLAKMLAYYALRNEA
ncbi:HD-GYP domain-containing protein [Desulfohalovibrio reitneri]|uniref:HD-GYP domain-containing protein n=1 Tax=Desulfohalovibrio reitneri TaxID=1307759 RepID=UPI000689C3AF|nr:HD domain-containing phosphohydrolase [Desulfohalovibrio reitneri]